MRLKKTKSERTEVLQLAFGAVGFLILVILFGSIAIYQKTGKMTGIFTNAVKNHFGTVARISGDVFLVATLLVLFHYVLI